MNNHYEAPEIFEIGSAHDVVLGGKFDGSEIVPPDPLPDSSVIDVDE